MRLPNRLVKGVGEKKLVVLVGMTGGKSVMMMVLGWLVLTEISVWVLVLYGASVSMVVVSVVV